VKLATQQTSGTYSLPGGLRLLVTVTGSSNFRRKLLEARWAHYRHQFDGPANLELHLGEFTPQIPDGARLIDKDYHVANQYLYFHGSRKGGQSEITLFDMDNRISLRHNPYTEPFPFSLSAGVRGMNMYLDPLMAWWYLRNGMTLLHASAIQRDGKTWLLVGTNGAGKTRLVLELCNKGYKFIADDLLVIQGLEVLGIVEHPAVLSLRWKEFLRSGNAHCSKRMILRHIGHSRQPDFGSLQLQTNGQLDGLIYLKKPFGSESMIKPGLPEIIWKQAVRLEHLELNRHQRRHWLISNFGRFLMAYEYGMGGSDIFDTLLNSLAPVPEQWLQLPAWTVSATEGFDISNILDIL
tara:strand:+ start:2095 stop:3147 length:1053 start_codon:yes stop_codon:yes gene_type:complete